MTAAVGSSQFPFPSVGSEDDEALLLLICGARVSEFVSSIVASDLCGRGEGFFFPSWCRDSRTAGATAMPPSRTRRESSKLLVRDGFLLPLFVSPLAEWIAEGRGGEKRVRGKPEQRD
jgi:hypothetical protein